MAVPYTFATATSSIPLSQLDANFATGITLGNTTVYLGNTTTSIGNLTLTNATISSVASTFPNSYLANSSVTIGSTNVSLGGTATTIAGLTLTSPTITGGTSTATQNLANVTGTLAVGNGGTGLTTLTAGYIPYGNGTSAFGSSANLTWNGSTLQVNTVSTNGLSVQAGPVYLNGYSAASYISGQASLSSGGTFTAQNSGSGTIGMLGSGDMSFYTNSGLTVGNTFTPTERMRITSAGSVLIGATSTPFPKLYVSDGTVGIGLGPYATGSVAYAGTWTNHSLAFVTNGAEVGRFDTSGNFGLGVTPSAWGSSYRAFNIQQFGSRTAALYGGSGVTGIGLTMGVYNDNTNFIYSVTGAPVGGYLINGAGNHLWFTGSSGTAGTTCTFTQAMTLDNSGNVGIGTTSPTYRLDVTNNSTGIQARLLSSSTSGTTLVLTNTATNGRSYGIGSNFSTGTGELAFYDYTASAERMRIDSSGNLLVGTTQAGQADGTYFQFRNGYTQVSHVTGTSSGATYSYFVYGGSGVGSITQNGTTGVLYNLTSDYRLKNNPTALTGASEFIMALQPKTWDWWDGSGKGVGFIAHEFMEVAKYSGNGTKDEVDEEGKPKYQSIQPSSSEVMANLVALVQEQQIIIEQLKAKVGI